MPSRLHKFVSIAILIFLVIGLHYFGCLNWLENFLRSIVSPLSKKVYSLEISINGQGEKFNSVDDLERAYQSAMEALLSERSENVKQQLLEQENVELRAQLKFVQAKKINSIGAEVIGKNIDPVGNTLIINRGKESGVILGDPVIVGDGIIIGKIARVEENLSIIRLINDNQSKIAATVMNKDKNLGIIEGGYGISVQMNYIPQNETINVGEIVVTSGLEADILRGLLIGTIEAVEKEAYQPFQKAMVKPFVNLDKIRLVSVILSTMQ